MTKSQKIFIPTLFVLLFFNLTLIFAQEKINSLAKGAWALQFGVQDNFIPTSFDGSTFAVKYHLSDGKALQLNFSYSSHLRSQEQKAFDASCSDRKAEDSQQNFELDVFWLAYPKIVKDVVLFFGLGPQIGIRYQEAKEANITHWNKSHAFTYGLAGIIGVEWFVRRRVSLFVEFQPAVSYNDSKVSQEKNIADHQTRSEITTKGFRYNSDTGLVGFALYF